MDRIVRAAEFILEELGEAPPEVLQALNQAAKKLGYPSWDKVPTPSRMTVAKLANNILKLNQGPKQGKQFESKNQNTAVAAKLWTAPVRIQQPNYVGYIDVTVTANNMQDARRLIKAQYGVADWHIGSTKEVK
jgi:hypothetical protein